MKDQKNELIAQNLRYLRQTKKWSQEYLAEQMHVSRQAVAKWEKGDTLPDIQKCVQLADLYDVDLNDLVRHDEGMIGLPIAPLNKHIFGVVKVGNKGQLVLPKSARNLLGIAAGDTLVVLGDSAPGSEGIALLKNETFMRITGHSLERLSDKLFPKDEI